MVYQYEKKESEEIHTRLGSEAGSESRTLKTLQGLERTGDTHLGEAEPDLVPQSFDTVSMPKCSSVLDVMGRR